MATRWGICSAGKISHDFVVALKTLSTEDHQVTAVAARELRQAQEFADKHGIPKVYGSYEELSIDPEIDVVYVGTIHPHHLRVGQLFMNAGKNVLIEKPLAMNAKEVKELVATAKKNKVFLMEALWTRFFPVSVEVRELLSHGDVGEFVLMVYRGERPESIQATGYKLDTGVDGHMVIVLKFSHNRMAVCTCSISMMLTNDAVIVGTKGMIKIPDHMWCPVTLEVNSKVIRHPLPEPCMPLNFTHSTGLRYEAADVRQCLLSGLKESSVMSLSESSLLAEIMDEARRQVGVTYSQDSNH
ncbi:trans-1,2-dihydrobenzene-1,2-diol dehydrogenase-like isoform X2 [Colossoma macropomum]|uniref:trans-1,2-dihydrobenzene-1,2-diol dehydrogenase-like isoform X2 n=1 Tax=Colossoma macropomum TaxID=42526 RepID=UPI001864C83C|nr:trans-1,2-dihydrobenzene-1,2-diol dehydrogenase-like isoform X2 [Colossoma macropomum]